MRLSLAMVAVAAALCFAESNDLAAQNQSREFIESTSPLPGGGWVTSRSEPGRGIQTVITMPGNNPVDDPRSVLDRSPSINRETESRPTEVNAPSPTLIGQPTVPGQRYVYPTDSRVAQSVVLHPPVRATAVVPQQVAWQTPTLGLGNTVTAQRANGLPACNCTPQTFQRVPVYQGAAFQVQPPASQAPSLTIQDPNQAAQFNSSLAPSPTFAGPSPQFGSTGQSGFWTPLTTGSGVYQPVIRLTNMQPGTYLGQGIIGQPKAYVDGQPIRNLFRYVFP